MDLKQTKTKILREKTQQTVKTVKCYQIRVVTLDETNTT